jgi:hypothetical protein
MATPVKKPSAEALSKIAEGWRYVTIPAVDVYEHAFDGIWRNNQEFKPGTHLLSAEDADYVEERLKVWQASMLRLMRPGIDRVSVQQANQKGQARSGGQVGEPAPEAGV